ncbi:MAG: hypothetical protein ABI779_15880 [Acidobacteriota bacterium]
MLLSERGAAGRLPDVDLGRFLGAARDRERHHRRTAAAEDGQDGFRRDGREVDAGAAAEGTRAREGVVLEGLRALDRPGRAVLVGELEARDPVWSEHRVLAREARHLGTWLDRDRRGGFRPDPAGGRDGVEGRGRADRHHHRAGGREIAGNALQVDARG